MIRIILITTIALLLGGCGNGSSEPALSKDIKYTISEDTRKGDIKRQVVVLLEEKVGEDELRQLASRIKNNDTSTYQRTFIGYYIKGKDSGSGFWATTHFNPNLQIRFFGLSKEEEESLTTPVPSSPDRKILGVWLDDRPGVGARMTMYYSKEGKLYLESSYSDGSSGTKEMIEFAIDNGKRIEDKEGNDFGEYFVVNKANQLEFWSKNGNYYTAKSIQ